MAPPQPSVDALVVTTKSCRGSLKGKPCDRFVGSTHHCRALWTFRDTMMSLLSNSLAVQ